tara:strand:- start:210 stop:455 length:246 start_codon:yes stop_codon:yes gene_type:complete
MVNIVQDNLIVIDELYRTEQETTYYTLLLVGIVFISFIIYFLPTLIGMNKRNGCAIFVLNLFLGWTFIGWVVALVWAFTKD